MVRRFVDVFVRDDAFRLMPRAGWLTDGFEVQAFRWTLMVSFVGLTNAQQEAYQRGLDAGRGERGDYSQGYADGTMAALLRRG